MADIKKQHEQHEKTAAELRKVADQHSIERKHVGAAAISAITAMSFWRAAVTPANLSVKQKSDEPQNAKDSSLISRTPK